MCGEGGKLFLVDVRTFPSLLKDFPGMKERKGKFSLCLLHQIDEADHPAQASANLTARAFLGFI